MSIRTQMRALRGAYGGLGREMVDHSRGGEEDVLRRYNLGLRATENFQSEILNQLCPL